ncbi:MAG: PEGA domain-containing protein [Phycisphaerae bacterium]|nr:PEGA domain-containing protein [Phycisphaerae bacterium]
MRNVLVMLIPAVLCVGCVEREWTIRSEPEGAIVWVSGVEKGRTPVTFDFTWYGNYEVILRKEGYETLKTSVNLKPPVYEYVGIDFFSEIAPWTYHDRRETLHVLKKTVPPTEEELKQRAREMRQENLLPG